MAKIKNSYTTMLAKMQRNWITHTVNGNVKLFSYSGKHFGSFLKTCINNMPQQLTSGTYPREK